MFQLQTHKHPVVSLLLPIEKKEDWTCGWESVVFPHSTFVTLSHLMSLVLSIFVF